MPELNPFRTEPKQLHAGAPGKVGFLKLNFEKKGNQTVLSELHRVAPLLVQQALYWDLSLPDMPCVFVASTSGGILQGDRLTYDIHLEKNAQAHITSQGATRLQAMDANYATQQQTIYLEAGSYLEWVPEMLIPYKNTRFVSHTDIHIDQDAVLFYTDIVMPGRKYYGEGELFTYDLLCLSIVAKRLDGQLLFTERLVLQPKQDSLRKMGIMGPFDVFGNAILLAPQEICKQVFSKIPPDINREKKCAIGINWLPNEAGIICRVLGDESATVRNHIREFWKVVRLEATGTRLPEEFQWR
ncbi:MAG: urease accessory protein UreD [Gammaproteobacteria bacterium RIFCSPHIGHO2_12_FULL_45_9]|nr:MAG: urease accessory protein UreD [Gammaproteobacteria bacterium RIFCSPHIGHO2_12_FULL_45_9]